jgi:hypothetical protein
MAVEEEPYARELLRAGQPMVMHVSVLCLIM